MNLRITATSRTATLTVALWALTGLGLLSCSEAVHPRLERVEVPLGVTWRWEHDEGAAARLVVEITPALAAASVSVEVNGPDAVVLDPAGERTFTQVTARSALTHEVRCSGLEGLDDDACLDVLIASSIDGLVMGRSMKIPLPGSTAGSGALPPAPGEFVEDDQDGTLRILPGKQTTTGR